MWQRRLAAKYRYWTGKLGKLFGFCWACDSKLNFTRNGQGVCPNINCKKRY